MNSAVLENIKIVMVNTTHPGNIGAAARAMKNMGLGKLVLVEPKEYPSDKAVWRAAGALDVLDKAEIVGDLSAAIKNCQLVIGTSARERRIPWPLLTPKECGDKVVEEAQHHEIAIVFGREDRGLTNEELQKCNFHVNIPGNPEYPVLNIAAAIQVVCYEIRMSFLNFGADKPLHFDDWDMPPAKQQDVDYYFSHLEETLEKLGFYDPGNPRQTITRLRRLYGRIRLDEMELSIMRGMLTSIQNYIHRAESEDQKK